MNNQLKHITFDKSRLIKTRFKIETRFSLKNYEIENQDVVCCCTLNNTCSCDEHLFKKLTRTQVNCTVIQIQPL